MLADSINEQIKRDDLFFNGLDIYRALAQMEDVFDWVKAYEARNEFFGDGL